MSTCPSIFSTWARMAWEPSLHVSTRWPQDELLCGWPLQGPQKPKALSELTVWQERHRVTVGVWGSLTAASWAGVTCSQGQAQGPKVVGSPRSSPRCPGHGQNRVSLPGAPGYSECFSAVLSVARDGPCWGRPPLHEAEQEEAAQISVVAVWGAPRPPAQHC